MQLSPNNVVLWNEWASLALQPPAASTAGVGGLSVDAGQAQARLERSLALDPEFGQTYSLLGDVALWQAQHAGRDAERATFAQQAVAAYQESLKRGDSAVLHDNLGQAFELADQPKQALAEYMRAVQMAGSGWPNVWQVYWRMAKLYLQNGDQAQARAFGEKAFEAAPTASQPEIRAWLNALP